DVACRAFALGLQPAQIGVRRYPGIGRDAFETAAHPASDQPLGGEQGHLRVVGDRPQTTISRCVLGDSLRAEAAENFGPLHELNRCAQRIADCATEYAAQKPPLDRALLLALAAPGR